LLLWRSTRSSRRPQESFINITGKKHKRKFTATDVYLRRMRTPHEPETHSTDTNNRVDLIDVAEGLGQDTVMHRFVFACLVLALMAQVSGAEGQTTSSEIDCTQETDCSITPDAVQNNEVFRLI
jgi:hypothetical protein